MRRPSPPRSEPFAPVASTRQERSSPSGRTWALLLLWLLQPACSDGRPNGAGTAGAPLSTTPRTAEAPRGAVPRDAAARADEGARPQLTLEVLLPLPEVVLGEPVAA